jgi:hypothetical protein
VDPIVIKMMADAAGLKRDMDKAQGIIGGATDKMRGALNSVKGALAGLGLGLSVAGLAAWVRSAIDAADEASKMAQKIGVATKDVAGLKLAFQLSGVESGKMVASMARLTDEIGRGNKAFGAMGVETRNADGTMRETTAVLRDMADRFSNLEDGTLKTALAVEVFGTRMGADMIPLLNGGAAALDEMDAMARKLGLTIDTETGKSAEQFNDTLELVRLSGQGVGTQIAAQLLPTLNALAGSMLDSVTEGDRLRRMADILAGALKGLYSVAVGVVEIFNTLGKAIGGSLAAIAAVLRGDFAEARQILKEASTDIREGWLASGEAISKAWSDAGSATVEAGVKVVKANREIAAALGGTTKANDAAAKAAARHAAEQAKLRDMLPLDGGLNQTTAETQRLTRANEDLAWALRDMVQPALEETNAETARLARQNQELVTASEQAAVAQAEAAEEMDRINRQIGQSLSDALMDGGRSAWEYIKGLFRSQVLSPVIQGVMAPVTGAMGSMLSGPASAASGVGALGSLGGLGGMLGGIGTAASTFGGAFVGGVGNLLQGTIGSALSGAGTLLGAGNISAGLGLGAGALGPIAAAAALIGSGLTRTLKDQGIQGDLSAGGIDGNRYSFYEGSWLKGDKTKRRPLDPEMESSLDAAVAAVYESAAASAEALGLSSSAIDSYTESIKLSTRKLTEDELAAALNEMLAELGENLAQQVGMTAEELSTLASTLTGANEVLGHFDQRLLDVSVAGGEAAVQLAQMMGGLDNLSGALATYAEQFTFGGDALAYTLDEVGKVLGDLGQTVPATRDEFMALVESQDLMTESGRSTYAALLQVAGAMDAVYDASEAAAAAATEAARAMSASSVSLTLGGSAADRLKAADAIRSGAAGADWLAAYQTDNANMNRPGSMVGDRIDLWAGAYVIRQAEDEALRAIKDANHAKQYADRQSSGGSSPGEQRQQEQDRLLQEQIKGTEGLIDAIDAMRRGMLDLKNELVGGALDPANPALKYASEREFVLGLGRQAAAGDMAAAEAFQGEAAGFLQLSQGYNASGEAYAADFSVMIGLLDKINASLDRQQSTAEATLKVQQSGLSQVADSTERTAQATDRQARTASVLEQRAIE